LSPKFARTASEAELSLTSLALHLVVFILLLDIDWTFLAWTFLQQSLLNQLLEFFFILFLLLTHAFMPEITCHFAVPTDVEIAFATEEIVFRQRSNSVAITADTILHVIAFVDHRREGIVHHDIYHFRGNLEDVILRYQRMFVLISALQARNLLPFFFDFHFQIVSHAGNMHNVVTVGQFVEVSILRLFSANWTQEVLQDPVVLFCNQILLYLILHQHSSFLLQVGLSVFCARICLSVHLS
jgi:hypothetical protein